MREHHAHDGRFIGAGRFHVVAKMNLALDDVRAAEARRMTQDGYEPLLKKSHWCLLKWATREPHRLAAAEAARSGSLQSGERARLPAEGTVPTALALQLADLGRQVP